MRKMTLTVNVALTLTVNADDDVSIKDIEDILKTDEWCLISHGGVYVEDAVVEKLDVQVEDSR